MVYHEIESGNLLPLIPRLRRRVPRAEALHSWRGTFHPISLRTKKSSKTLDFDVLVQLWDFVVGRHAPLRCKQLDSLRHMTAQFPLLCSCGAIARTSAAISLRTFINALISAIHCNYCILLRFVADVLQTVYVSLLLFTLKLILLLPLGKRKHSQ